MKDEEYEQCSEHTGVHQQPPSHPAVQRQERGKHHDHSRDNHANENEKKNCDDLGEYSRGWTGEQGWHEWTGSKGER